MHQTLSTIMTASIFALGIFGDAPLRGPERLKDLGSIAKAIKDGELGPEFAEQAKKDDHFQIKKIQDPGVPFEFYVVGDYRREYTVMVEKEHLVLLCSGFGGGHAHNFTLTSESGKPSLNFQYESGSGITIVFDCQYVLNSGIVNAKARPFQQ
jgi:hypothetical protein